jgi:hypothetical protein
MPEQSERSLTFEGKKREFFTGVGLRARNWLEAHKYLGLLWEGSKKKRWENVSEHCLVEAARGEIFADLLKLGPQAKEDLFAAAILHDFNKREEILYTAEHGRTPESFNEAYAKARKELKEASFPEKLITIADSVGHASLEDVKEILSRDELLELDINRLVMHYLDDYTVGTDWVKPAEQNEHGIKNDLDRRMDANDTNEKYAKIAEKGFYKEQRRVGYLVEQRIAKLIKQRSENEIEPKNLPEFVDQIIKSRIEQ